MTPEELFQQRYKIIEGAPLLKNNIGEIIICDHPSGRIDCDFLFAGKVGFAPDDYPHLFKKLEWWEDRNIADMPKYVKQTGMIDSQRNPVPDWYLKVKKHFTAGNGEWRDDSLRVFCAYKDERTIGISMTYSVFEPATEQEYNDYLNSKK